MSLSKKDGKKNFRDHDPVKIIPNDNLSIAITLGLLFGIVSSPLAYKLTGSLLSCFSCFGTCEMSCGCSAIVLHSIIFTILVYIILEYFTHE